MCAFVRMRFCAHAGMHVCGGCAFACKVCLQECVCASACVYAKVCLICNISCNFFVRCVLVCLVVLRLAKVDPGAHITCHLWAPLLGRTFQAVKTECETMIKS